MSSTHGWPSAGVWDHSFQDASRLLSATVVWVPETPNFTWTKTQTLCTSRMTHTHTGLPRAVMITYTDQFSVCSTNTLLVPGSECWAENLSLGLHFQDGQRSVGRAFPQARGEGGGAGAWIPVNSAQRVLLLVKTEEITPGPSLLLSPEFFWEITGGVGGFGTPTQGSGKYSVAIQTTPRLCSTAT